MEKEINVAEILKDKPKGTKLYADAFGELSLECVNLNRDNSIYVKTKTFNCCSFYSDGKYTKDGEPILVPSKSMRDWSKFAWKKGDVLANNIKTIFIIFNEFEDDTYGTFKGKYCLIKISSEEEYTNEESNFSTSLFEKANDDEAKAYIKTIEEHFGGKLNLETLEIEKQQEFKDGDIITITPQIGNNLIFIFRSEDVGKYYCHAFLDGNIAIVNDDGYCKKDFCTARPSTEEEKLQLFDALAKKGKVWDSKKKQIVDLKPKWWTPKPFDRVITRNDYDDIWTANIFSHMDSYGEYVTIGCVGGYHYCLPYNADTAKFIGTTDDWKVGEG